MRELRTCPDFELRSVPNGAGGSELVYLASADWMGRNLFRRIEVAFPVLDPKLKRRVIEEGLRPYLEDSAEAWTLL